MRIRRDDLKNSIFKVRLDGRIVAAISADDEEGWVVVKGEKLYGKVEITKTEVCVNCRERK